MNPAARVIPDVASFSVDNGFWYSIPEHLIADVGIGTIVRVPLSGRRVRGWVVELSSGRNGTLKDLAGVSGAAGVFTPDLLKGLLWAANHYVTPVSGLLARATPPNLPRSLPSPVAVPVVEGRPHPISPIVERSASDIKTPITALVAPWQDLVWLGSFGPILRSGKSILVIAASVAEVGQIADETRRLWGDVAVEVSSQDDASETAAWESAQSAPRLVVGTPKTSTWQVANLAMVIVLEESRRVMKDRQTPTLHVRDVVSTRSRLETFNLVFFGPTPGVELLSSGADVIRSGNRAWPLVEVVDRSDDPPGSGYLSDRTVAAIKGAVAAGRRVFVFTHRRLGFGSLRCVKCRSLRTCRNCGSRLARVETCPRCGAAAGTCRTCGAAEFEEMGTIPDRLTGELNRRLGAGTAAVHPAASAVSVGTERDLAGLSQVELAVAADVDGMLMGIGYRTAEEALRQLGRLALTVASAKGSRLMLQTSRPDSLLVTTMRRGDPIPYLERVLVERAKEGSPPSTEMLILEVRGDVPPSAGDDLAELDDAVIVMGPMTIEDGRRWLLSGDLGKARRQLRMIVGRWRDRGATVRIDADPIDV